MDSYVVRKLGEIEAVPCPCGQSRRAFAEQPDQRLSLHRVDIRVDSVAHYHRRTTEVYYVLEGRGTLELDGESVALEPEMTILIRPGCRHRATGNLKIINVCVPAFDPADEYLA